MSIARLIVPICRGSWIGDLYNVIVKYYKHKTSRPKNLEVLCFGVVNLQQPT
jgi:hypothetical protein